MNTPETDASQTWSYPGSRWWKFDFHTHTPASMDTTHWQEAKGTPDEVTPEKWLLRYMQAGIDCIAVTDHNSGAWIDSLKTAYARMKEQAAQGMAPDGFREITLYPGVEISVNGGFHLLAIMGGEATTSDIDSLLGKVDYSGTKGDSDGVSRKSPAEVAQAVLDAGGIPIPAHADRDKGVLAVEPGTKKCRLDSTTVKQLLEIEDLLAVEWVDTNSPFPEVVENAPPNFPWCWAVTAIPSKAMQFRDRAIPG
ncbi:hypothetical protein HML84_06545 [Alcanivorax sp. IO_7]|nr:hypothetical protein HML84_06545 [Alcanivorax sp. IO_7]